MVPHSPQMQSSLDEIRKILAHTILEGAGGDITASRLDFRGGKMARPALLLTSARLFNAPEHAALSLAAAVELFHNASLAHDDIVDDAPMRRGKPSLHISYGAKAAVLTGDYLFVSGFLLLSKYGTRPLLTYFAERLRRMAGGEIVELNRENLLTMNEEDYFRWVDAKTGALFECSLAAGALLAEAEEEAIDLMTRLGKSVGRLFQLTDDILDYRGDSQKTGKLGFADFRGGKVTLPLILLLKACDKKRSGKIRELFGMAEAAPQELQELAFEIENGGVVQALNARINALRIEAYQTLEALSRIGEIEGLKGFIDWMTARES